MHAIVYTYKYNMAAVQCDIDVKMYLIVYCQGSNEYSYHHALYIIKNKQRLSKAS